jgi:hypothetical protein
MKKLVFAFVMAFTSICLVSMPTLRAQDSDQIALSGPEYNAYQMAKTQSDPKLKAEALESFLQTYPQSKIKEGILDMLVDTYQGLNSPDKALSAASRLLQVDPNNMKAIYYSALIKKGQCAKTQDAQACDDAAVLAKKGLTIVRPADTTEADWKNLIDGTYPAFHSIIALDEAISRKDFKAAIAEYRAELMLYNDEQSKTVGLPDTLQLAQAYVQPGARDLVQAIWFYARVWNYAPAVYKAKIEPDLERYYQKYHGNLTGLDDVKAQAATTTFPPATFAITPAPTPAEQIHALLASTPNLNVLALSDKETILAVGAKEDADKMWALLKDQVTPVPGIVIEATATVIKVAVTKDSRDAKVADFIVNLKKPLTDKDIPAVGFEFKGSPAASLVGTYDSYTQIPATDTTVQSAQIVLRDGEVIPAEKKPAAAPRKPAAGHKK